ncbi:MAG: 3-dehydroquinate synthase [Oscillospiraceae bacterium]|nr:3-dehydroquinate synthase [Oscillospiraceae bacterium]
MRTITVSASKSYDVRIGEGLLDAAGALLRETADGQTAAVVSDETVAALYGRRLTKTLAQNGYRTEPYVFPVGETSKNAETFLSLLDFLAEKKLSRADVVVALGGGVAGDLAGFAAACYMRGVRFAQIPTTLLAAVDSSVGGKTAVNLAAGKNLAGAFYQPDAVICDVSLLSTLPQEVFLDGCAEVIKTGIIADRALFDALETPVPAQLEDVIARCVEIKRDIVAEDEFEHGRRKLLNFGHTAGHAIELLSGYQTSHGRAVAVGMAIATRAAVRMGLCGEDCLREVLAMLRRYELPVSTRYGADALAAACLSDKKRDGGVLTMVFPAEIGRCVLRDVPVGELESVIASGLEV